jgi:hypothetical protein
VIRNTAAELLRKVLSLVKVCSKLFEGVYVGDRVNSMGVVMCPMGLGRALDDVLTKLEKALRSSNSIEIV